MPTYEYRCTSCAWEFEKFQRMSEEPKADCPECGAAAERRLSAGAGFLFKGSGFYITDYRGEGYRKAAEKDSGGPSKSESGAGSKPEAKGESKAEPKPGTGSRSDSGGSTGSASKSA
jgi:putative FmdB family regulatory protein